MQIPFPIVSLHDFIRKITEIRKRKIYYIPKFLLIFLLRVMGIACEGF